MALSESVLCIALSPIEGVLKTCNLKLLQRCLISKKVVKNRESIESLAQIVNQQHCKVNGDLNMIYNFAFMSTPELKMAIQLR